MIFYKAGEKQLAKSILQQASVTNSYIGSTLKAETAAAMQDM
jgi:hypothetical protein